MIGRTYNFSTFIHGHLISLSNCLDSHLSTYENIIILGDFNCDPKDTEIIDFCSIYGLKNIIHTPTCFKNVNNPSLIDLILTNRYRSFQSTTVAETGLSDFHKMTVTVLKTFFKKAPPKIITYRDYKYYSHKKFRIELESALNEINLFNISNDEFASLFMDIFERHAPLKQKYVRANQSPFITKNLRKEFMKRSRLLNAYHRDHSVDRKNAYRKQRNLCTSLFKKSKKEYYSRLHPSSVSNNKKFWKSVKPLFSDKVFSTESITLVENESISDDNAGVAQEFSDFFRDAVKNLDIQNYTNYSDNNSFENIEDPIFKAIKKFDHHPSILKILGDVKLNNAFSFFPVTPSTVSSVIYTLNKATACPKHSIPSKIIKDNQDIFSLKISNDYNYSINTGVFPGNLKLADVTPVHKKGDRTEKSNYRPVSILSAMSKILRGYYIIN